MNDLAIKPDIAAPGGDIISTSLDGQFATLTSTWAATPYAAGVAALYIGKYGGRKTNPHFNAADLVMRIISSGQQTPYLNRNAAGLYPDLDAPVAQVGTGIINATKVLEYTTTLSLTKFALNDTRNFEPRQSVDITNNALADVTYTFSLRPGPGFETWVPYNSEDATSPRIALGSDLVPQSIVPGVEFPRGTFKVLAGKTETAE